MRLVALALGFALLTPSAWAFDCTGVKLPSNIVICSDPELMRLADERQQIYNEARSRLTPEQQKAIARGFAASLGRGDVELARAPTLDEITLRAPRVTPPAPGR